VNKQLSRHGIVRLWLVQIGVISIITLVCAIAVNINAAKSALLGGLVYIIPNAYFAIKLFQYQGARAAKQIVNGFYKGEALKIILSMLLFTLVFVFCKVTPLPFFASYIVVLMTHWFTPWIMVNKQNRHKSD
jgi:ATP synthase protein I